MDYYMLIDMYANFGLLETAQVGFLTMFQLNLQSIGMHCSLAILNLNIVMRSLLSPQTSSLLGHLADTS